MCGGNVRQREEGEWERKESRREGEEEKRGGGEKGVVGEEKENYTIDTMNLGQVWPGLNPKPCPLPVKQKSRFRSPESTLRSHHVLPSVRCRQAGGPQSLGLKLPAHQPLFHATNHRAQDTAAVREQSPKLSGTKYPTSTGTPGPLPNRGWQS